MKKLFGEPAALIGLVEGALALLVAFSGVLTGEQATLVVVALTALGGVYTAYVTRDMTLGLVVGAAKALLAVGVGFGLTLSLEQTGALLAMVTVLFGFFQRTQTSPARNPGFRNEYDLVA